MLLNVKVVSMTSKTYLFDIVTVFVNSGLCIWLDFVREFKIRIFQYNTTVKTMLLN